MSEGTRCDRSLDAFFDGFFTGRTVCHTTRQFGHVNDKGSVFVAPEDDQFVTRFHSLIIRQSMSNDHSSHLLDLIRFRHRPIFLQIDHLDHTVPAKHVVASPDAFLKPEGREQMSQIVEANVRVRRSAEHLLQGLRVTRQVPRVSMRDAYRQ